MKAEELKDKEDLKDGVMPASLEGDPNEGSEGSEDLDKGDDDDKDDDDKDDKPTFGGGPTTFPIEK